MFTKKTLRTSVITGIIAFIMSFALAGCGAPDHDTSKTFKEQVADAGLPKFPATERDFEITGEQACTLRKDGVSHEKIMDYMYTGKAASYLTEGELAVLTDIIYANYCPDYRVKL